MTSHADGTIRTWDPDTFVARGAPIPVGYPYQNVLAVSHDRRWIAIKATPSFQSGVVRVWEIDTGRLAAELDDLDQLSPEQALGAVRKVTSLSFSPDGASLAASNFAAAAVVWNTRTWQRDGDPVATRGIFTLAFSPDGRYLVTGNQYDNRLTIRDAHTHQPVGAVLTGHTGLPVTLQFTPDGRRLLSMGIDGLRLWDVDARAELAAFPFDSPSVTTFGAGAAYFILSQMTPDGKRLTRIEGDHIQIWNLQPETWPDIACRAAGRNLTTDEWAQFGPHDVYSETCPA